MGAEDISRIIFDQRKRYSGVRMQQGRVITDDDWNEQERITSEDQRQERVDIIGAAGSPDDGFLIANPEISDGLIDFSIHSGSVYIGGERTSTVAEQFREQADWLLQDKNVHPAPQKERYDLVYLYAWEQPVSSVEDSELLEVALGGPDTSTRKRLLHHVKIFEDVNTEICGIAWKKLKDKWAEDNRGSLNSDSKLITDAKLTVDFSEDSKQDDLCAPNIAGGYLGAENQAVRVQLIDANHFTWGFDNASPLYRVSATPESMDVTMVTEPKDQVHWPLSGQVVEILPRMALLPNGEKLAGVQGHLTKVDDSYDPVTGELTLTEALPTDFGEEWDDAGDDYFFMRVWNRGTDSSSDAAIEFNPGNQIALGQTGLLITFSGTQFNGGDYWVIAARPDSPNEVVPWQLTEGKSPHGLPRYAAPLAIIHWKGEADDQIQGEIIRDCRKKFRPLTEQDTCCTYSVGDGVQSFGDFNCLNDAAQNLPPKGGQICLLPGLHSANMHLINKEDITIKGCGKRSKLIPMQGQRSDPIIRITDCKNIEIREIDFITHDGAALLLEGTEWGELDSIDVVENRFLALTNAIRIHRGRNINIRQNSIRVLDRSEGEACISIMAEEASIDENDIAVIPADIQPPYDDAPPDVPGTDDVQPNPVDPCADTEIAYASYGYIVYYADFLWNYSLVALPKNPYQAFGGIHLLGSCENVDIRRNTIVGGEGNGLTLGGLPFGSENQQTQPEGVQINHKGDVFYAAVGDLDGNTLPGIDVYLRNDTNTYHDITDEQGGVTIQAPPGQYDLYLQQDYAIDHVERRNIGDRITYFAIFAKPVEVEVIDETGFLYQICIENNEIRMMGHSGIGFALIQDGTPFQPDISSDNALIQVFLNLFISRFAGGMNQVRELNISENYIHHNFRNPLNESLREETKNIGFGGISLGLCDDVNIRDNTIVENGTPTVPTCGIFSAYIENAEITGNSIDNNGPVPENFDGELPSGIRGGIYVKFASSLSAASESATNHRLAIRMQDNRIDQPAGRSITLMCFGAVSCTDNHINSEYTGDNGLLNILVGGILIINLGGIQNLFQNAQTIGETGNETVGHHTAIHPSAATSGFNRLQSSIADLPSGATLFNNNQIRQGIPNKSATSTLVVTMDDLGIDGNQCYVLNEQAILINLACMANTVRVSDNRFREFSPNAYISMYSTATMMNTASYNQADHCILVRGPDTQLPVVDQGNLVVNAAECKKRFSEDPESFITAQLYRYILAAQYGSQLPSKENANQFISETSSESLRGIQSMQVTKRAQINQEKWRLSRRLGTQNYRVLDFQGRLNRSANILSHLEVETELARITPQTPTENESVVEGRIALENNRGLQGMEVHLVNANGDSLGYKVNTDKSGHYSIKLDETARQKLAEEQVFVRVNNPNGETVYSSEKPVTIRKNEKLTEEVKVPRDKALGDLNIFRQ